MKICLIVGCDRVGAAEKVLKKQYGVAHVVHWTGRKARSPTCLPKGVSMVLVVTGYVNHGLVHRTRKLAESAGVQVKYVSRGLAGLELSG